VLLHFQPNSNEKISFNIAIAILKLLKNKENETKNKKNNQIVYENTFFLVFAYKSYAKTNFSKFSLRYVREKCF